MIRQLKIRLQRKPEAQYSADERAILAREPEQDAAVSICSRAWNDLSTCRSIGMGVWPIGFDKMLEWARFEGLDYIATRIVWAVIRRLDSDRIENERSA